MTVRDLIYTISQKDDLSLDAMAAKMGQSRNAVRNGIADNDGQGIRVSTFLKWMEALGYEVIVQDPFGGDEDEWVLDGEPEGVENEIDTLQFRRMKSWM